MPKFSTEGKFLKYQELDGKEWVFTVKSFKHESIGQGDEKELKWVLYFEEMEKGFVLNKTNGVVICEMYGEEMDGWVGKKISLYEKDDVEFGGKLVSAIRVRRKVPV